MNLVKSGYDVVMPHLTCVGASKDELCDIIDSIYHKGFINIMTLRGDPPRGDKEFKPVENGLQYATQLVELIKSRHNEICCGVAGYPEAHPEAESLNDDINHLKEKVDAGGDFITTQVFFDNDQFKNYTIKCREADVEKPILPGLLPVTSLQQLSKIMQYSDGEFPAELAKILEDAGSDTPEAAQAGITWTINQIKGLLDYGVPGIHFYVLNKSDAVITPELIECFGRKS